MVLYLIDKNKQIDCYELELQKNDQDSLVYYKDRKQLAQLLLQSYNIYDLVYILTKEINSQVKNIVKHHPNCFLVEFDSEKEESVKNNTICVPGME